MAILANGYIGATGVFQIQGATAINNAYPSARLANFSRTGAMRNITAGEGINSGLVSLPSGNRHPSAWMMPQKPGALAARNSVTGEGGVSSANVWAVKLAQAALTGSGSLEAIGGLIVQLIADIAGSGGISEGDLKAFLQALADIGGSGGISDAQASGLGELIAAITGLGTVDATLTGSGELTADLVVTGTGLTTSNVGQAVWAALAAAINVPGTAGAALLAAGSAGDPWSTALPGSYASGTAGALLAALVNGLTTEQATQLLEVFQRLGLDPAAPMTTSPTAITFGSETIAISEAGSDVTLTRSP